MTVRTRDVPYVPDGAADRGRAAGQGLLPHRRQLRLHGRARHPARPRAVPGHGLPVDLMLTSFFLARETLIPSPRPVMNVVEEQLFMLLPRRAVGHGLLQIPPDRWWSWARRSRFEAVPQPRRASTVRGQDREVGDSLMPRKRRERVPPARLAALEEETAACGASSRPPATGAARFRAILESAADYAILTLDPDLRVTGWNKGAENLLGWSEAEALGMDGRLTFTPEDRELGEPEAERPGRGRGPGRERALAPAQGRRPLLGLGLAGAAAGVRAGLPQGDARPHLPARGRRAAGAAAARAVAPGQELARGGARRGPPERRARRGPGGLPRRLRGPAAGARGGARPAQR